MSLDNITAEEAVRRMSRAEDLLNDPLMDEAFEKADATFVGKWRNATTPEAREAAWHGMTGLAEARRVLRSIITDGEFAEHQTRE